MTLPSGTITFLFTDIEGSTKLWESHPLAMKIALARHDEILRESIRRNNGSVFKTVGDAFHAAFESASGALAAAVDIQLTLKQEDWGEIGQIRVRIALNTGAADERDGDYFGTTLNRLARLQAVANGQQIVVSNTAYEAVQGCLPEGCTLNDLGMHRFKDLASPERVWQLIHPSLQYEFPPLRSLEYLPTNLPHHLTAFIGRERDMARVKELLQTSRLVTLTGSGGTGKTRLALQAAADVIDQYADGVWLAELAPVSDPRLVPQALAEALDVRETPGEPVNKTLLSFVQDKQMLLVIDNCEHVLDASARLINSILQTSAKVKVLASSREALGITGEIAQLVPSLSAPEPGTSQTPESLEQYDAVRLFIDRASAVNNRFAVTSQNAASVASVCRRLDGIPLAIELAAARLRAMPLEQIEARLDDSFRLLTGGSRTALPRQQTLRALIDWSYDLLSEQEKSLLRRLSVFAGGWTLEGAEAVCGGDGEAGRLCFSIAPSPLPSPTDGRGDNAFSLRPASYDLLPHEVLDLLTALVDKSLVVYAERETGARYHLLETVRQYARDRLMESGETERLRDRHMGYFLTLAEEADAELTGPNQAKWLRRLDEDMENLRAALNWSLTGWQTELRSVDTPKRDASGACGSSTPYLLRPTPLLLCGALQRFWWTRGHVTEGRNWCATVLANYHEMERTTYLAKALTGAGAVESIAGNDVKAREYSEAGLAIRRELGDRRGIAVALNNLGLIARNLRDSAAERACLEESLAIGRELNVPGIISNALYNLGLNRADRGDFDAAASFYLESLGVRREMGDKGGIANSLNALGCVAYTLDDFAGAIAYHKESLTLGREIGDMRLVAFSLLGLGHAARKHGDFSEAESHFRECLALYVQAGDRRGIDQCLDAFALLANTLSCPGRAASLWGAAGRLREEVESPKSEPTEDSRKREVSSVREAMGEEQFNQAWAKGHAMTMEEAIELALSQC